MTRTYYPVASCDESRKSGFEREDWEATPSSTPAPSFSLTDTRYRPLENPRLLAFGVSESTQRQTPLPAVAVELPILRDI
ncbi:MAG: hypothetical protein EBE86_018015 [Hormoscilla sp. GUM202]|nr:hypothetical protein [Hormoscilla sp. GUM202]